jgi:hypothetical protein
MAPLLPRTAAARESSDIANVKPGCARHTCDGQNGVNEEWFSKAIKTYMPQRSEALLPSWLAHPHSPPIVENARGPNPYSNAATSLEPEVDFERERAAPGSHVAEPGPDRESSPAYDVRMMLIKSRQDRIWNGNAKENMGSLRYHREEKKGDKRCYYCGVAIFTTLRTDSPEPFCAATANAYCILFVKPTTTKGDVTPMRFVPLALSTMVPCLKYRL